MTEPPQAVTISACQDAITDARQLTARFGLRFDVPRTKFRVAQGQRDMPPESVYVVIPNDYANAKLTISPDVGDFRDLELAWPTFSKHVAERIMRDVGGHDFGSDRWGYLKSGERWRHVKFSTGDHAGYEPLPPSQADLLDQIVNSACFATGENLKK